MSRAEAPQADMAHKSGHEVPPSGSQKLFQLRPLVHRVPNPENESISEVNEV